jgi:uncharacterized protein
LPSALEFQLSIIKFEYIGKVYHLIIDMHCHLGNILYPGGGDVVLSARPMARPFDLDAPRRLMLYGFNALDAGFYSLPAVKRQMTEAERRRNFTATLSNLSSRLARYGIDHACVMPIAPNTAFFDVLPAIAKEPRIIPFGSFDFTSPDLKGQAQRQLALGAKGFKLHTILQRVSPCSPEVNEALSGLPEGTVVLFHAGEANYYPPRESSLQCPEFGRIEGLAQMCAAFPALRFVAAHGGLREFKQLIEQLSPLKNVWVDTSFVSPQGIRMLINAFGAGRVLFASDWPYGFHSTGIMSVKAACRGNTEELEAILGGNAGKLLGL